MAPQTLRSRMSLHCRGSPTARKYFFFSGKWALHFGFAAMQPFSCFISYFLVVFFLSQPLLIFFFLLTHNCLCNFSCLFTHQSKDFIGDCFSFSVSFVMTMSVRYVTSPAISRYVLHPISSCWFTVSSYPASTHQITISSTIQMTKS